MISSPTLARPAAAGAAVLLCLAGASARADDAGLYVGATGGITASSYGQHALDQAVTAAATASGYDLKLGTTSLETGEPAAAAVVGYMLNSVFGFEASYLYVNTERYRTSAKESYSTLTGPVTVPFDFALNLTSRGPTLALVGALPLIDGWQLDGRVGAYEGSMRSDYWTRAGTYKTSGSESETSTSLMLNAGTSYVFAAHWVVRLEYVYLNHLSEKVTDTSYNAGLALAGVTYWF
jgi:opacity protein-like surface antigen